MTNDELRALADALEPMARAPRFEDFDVPGFCAWVRACADAQPVAWIGPSRPKIDGADYRVLRQDYDASHGYGWSRDTAKANGFLPLYTHSAPAAPQGDASRMSDALQSIRKHVADDPSALAAAIVATCDSVLDAAPQAEPCIGNDSACPCQDGDACHYKDSADGTKAWPVPQSEPKRDPLHGLAPTHRCPACGAFWRQCDDASWNLRSASCCGLCDAGRVELVCWLDEPKREPLSDDIISYEHACRSSYEPTCAASDFNSFKLGVRFAERAHGIGGSDAE